VRRVRWECPNGCAAVLGPSRPRRDDVARYCLRCSAQVGRLVDRTSPALARERGEKVQRRLAADAKRSVRREECEAARFTVAGLDLRVELACFLRLDAIRSNPLTIPIAYSPRLRVRRFARKPSLFGLARYHAWEIVILAYPGITRDDVRETLLHEVVHFATRSGHDTRFRTVFRLAAEEAFGVRPRLETRYHGEVTRLVRAASEEKDPTPSFSFASHGKESIPNSARFDAAAEVAGAEPGEERRR
jgi:hypothetical protein